MEPLLPAADSELADLALDLVAESARTAGSLHPIPSGPCVRSSGRSIATIPILSKATTPIRPISNERCGRTTPQTPPSAPSSWKAGSTSKSRRIWESGLRTNRSSNSVMPSSCAGLHDRCNQVVHRYLFPCRGTEGIWAVARVDQARFMGELLATDNLHQRIGAYVRLRAAGALPGRPMKSRDTRTARDGISSVV